MCLIMMALGSDLNRRKGFGSFAMRLSISDMDPPTFGITGLIMLVYAAIEVGKNIFPLRMNPLATS